MNCDICHRHPATIHIQELINGERKALHLCGDCASRQHLSHEALQDFSLSEFLGQFNELTEALDIDEPTPQVLPDVTCSHCGTTAEQLQETNRLGCPECYQELGILLDDIFDATHRGRRHVGQPPNGEKIQVQEAAPATAMLDLQRDLLQRELQDAVAIEDYERAAQLRDKLRHLENS